MALINSPAIARKLQRILRLQQLPDTILGPEVVPVIIVEDASQLRVNASEEEKPCLGFSRSVAVAGANSHCVIRKPFNVTIQQASKLRIIVDGVWVSPNAPTDIAVVYLNTLPALDVTKRFKDATLRGLPEAEIGTQDNVGVLGVIVLRLFSAGTGGLYLPLGIELPNPTLTNNEGIGVVPTGTNTLLDASWDWRELPPFG